MTNGDGIQYTVKEMLAQIDGKITVLTQRMDSKVDSGAVDSIKDRVTAVERELDRREALINRVNEKADIAYVNGIKEDVHELGTHVDDLRKAVMGAAISITGGAILFAATLFVIFK